MGRITGEVRSFVLSAGATASLDLDLYDIKTDLHLQIQVLSASTVNPTLTLFEGIGPRYVPATAFGGIPNVLVASSMGLNTPAVGVIYDTSGTPYTLTAHAANESSVTSILVKTSEVSGHIKLYFDNTLGTQCNIVVRGDY